MDDRVGRLTCRFRVVGDGGADPRLDRITRLRLVPSFERSLERGLGGDARVHVIRRVAAGVAVADGDDADRLVRRLADELAGAVMETIAGPGEDVVTFDDEAAFVARFAADLVGGEAWEHWYYAPFAELRGHAAPLRTLLLEHRALLPAILARLAALGALDAVLAALDPAAERLLLRDADGAEAAAGDSARPLLATAARVAERLGAWRGGTADLAAASERYARSAPPARVWRDRRELAAGVLHALRFLVGEGLLAGGAVAVAGVAREAAVAAVEGLDWLDAGWLAARLADPPPALAGGDAAARTGEAFHARPRPFALTPLQDRALAAIAALMDSDAPLDLSRPAAETSGLWLLAALAARDPELAAQPGVRQALSTLLDELREAARRVRDDGMLVAEAAPAAPFLAALGPAAERLVRLAAVAAVPEPERADRGAWMFTRHAGACLPLRAALDLRVPALTRGAFRPVALALMICWAGEQAQSGGIDAALCMMAGLEAPLTTDEFDAALAAVDRTALAAGLADALAAHRIGTGDGLPDLAAGTPFGWAAAGLIRAWARWLPGFANASTAFVLEQWIRRGGQVRLGDGRVDVRIDPAPLDVVLDLVGYGDTLEAHSALGHDLSITVEAA